jgi:menaquinone-9 beta-reductase
MFGHENETAFAKLGTDWDVVVIGAGPAGALSAFELAKRDFKVLLVDKLTFPRSKVCGCCLNQDAVHSLERAGLLDMPVFKDAPALRRLNLYTKFGRVSIPLAGGFAISRQALDGAIVEAAITRGVSFLSGTTAQVGAALAGGRMVHLRNEIDERLVKAAYVIVGDGIAGTSLKGDSSFAPLVTPSSRIGIGTLIPNRMSDLKPGEIAMYCSRRGYLGMIGVENEMVDAAAAIDRVALVEKNSAAGVVKDILESCKATPPAELLEAQWRGTSSLTRRRSVTGHKRVFLVGDAAGYTEPFSGQGIAWALKCAVLIAPIIEGALKGTISDPEKHWSKTYQQEIRTHQRASSLLAMLLRYESVFSLVVITMSFFPAALRLFLDHLNQVQKNYQTS